jgi:hypothetical protein
LAGKTTMRGQGLVMRLFRAFLCLFVARGIFGRKETTKNSGAKELRLVCPMTLRSSFQIHPQQIGQHLLVNLRFTA